MSTFADKHKDFCEHVLLKNRCHECVARKECEQLAQAIEKDYWPQLRKIIAGSVEVSEAKCCRYCKHMQYDTEAQTRGWQTEEQCFCELVPGFHRVWNVCDLYAYKEVPF
jgi:hypothetical protein